MRSVTPRLLLQPRGTPIETRRLSLTKIPWVVRILFRNAWDKWCNVKGSAFGTRPSMGSILIDTILWVKPGGELDGTSSMCTVRYEGLCGKYDGSKPSPEAGTCHQHYLVMSVQDVRPTL
ncbi:cellulase [Thelephora ganbajun]|uniref:Cellulase n=1 Tax=Thelephora ganbajun TaxID=370292 RepID=A0ACB6ZTN9_THEGA|nr:cellulase [Thelephora ganbajun]